VFLIILMLTRPAVSQAPDELARFCVDPKDQDLRAINRSVYLALPEATKGSLFERELPVATSIELEDEYGTETTACLIVVVPTSDVRDGADALDPTFAVASLRTPASRMAIITR